MSYKRYDKADITIDCYDLLWTNKCTFLGQDTLYSYSAGGYYWTPCTRQPYMVGELQEAQTLKRVAGAKTYSDS